MFAHLTEGMDRLAGPKTLSRLSIYITFGKDILFSRCLPAGLPMVMMFPVPFKILQSGELTAILYETNGAYRQIFTDRRALPKDPNRTWMGYSIGRWERDALVVESTGSNAKTWLSGIGHPHGEGLHLTERYRRRDFGYIDLQITIDDSEWYEKPWTVSVIWKITPDTELLEDVCLENERDAVHLGGKVKSGGNR
jgi:hypothetical protein